MTTESALVLLAVAFALIITAGISVPQRRRAATRADDDSVGSGEVESALLRRPLRSRYPA
jgi:hypothetical protein